MTTNVEDSMVWSKLCWQKSWASCSDVDDILPKVGQVYAVSLWEHRMPSSCSNAIIWKPPHSDLNGWADERPSEILKSYVLEGKSTNPSNNSLSFEFIVKKRTKLVDFFEIIEKNDVSPLCELEQKNQWMKSVVGKYVYVHNHWEDSELEIILSWEGSFLCIHYVALHRDYSGSWAVVTRYTPSLREHLSLERLLKEAYEVIDISYDGLPECKVLGALYQ